MITTDKERYQMSVDYARTMLMMARIIKERYGVEDSSFKSYVRRSREAYENAKFYYDRMNEETVQIYLAA